VSIKLKSRDAAVPFAEQLRAQVGPKIEVATWVSETAEMMAIQNIRRRALNLVMFVLMTLAAFGIANTILMAAHERIREIGTLRAMGLTEPGVIGLFLVEGSIIGAIGAVAGAAWGSALVLHWAESPIDLSDTYEKMGGGISASSLIYTHFDPLVLTATVIVGVLVAIVASIYPARVASRLVPGEAVRAES
jgi:ABC-type lipoprotein release transport system permease subunit